ncbi:MAG TPA: type II toxin-antitoxin system death-on-curing family toxin [Gracilimonas sp.]|uniref:type II toxin-antitoxin system death-on-curing family toxin n=1 Tax=Gracilimonas sp. TaxID=1974203 RepID=UPI002D8737F9|nr:type II toxin-antitoxin system death-on-curing family toxin [Gracilimonas sp.]
MSNPVFLTLEEILYIHEQEIIKAGGEPNIRNKEDVEACAEVPKASFDGEYLNDLFEMAASYIICLAIRHPFVDGNKRTALASCLTFLYLNGFEILESYEHELADLVLNFLTHEISKDEVANHLKKRSKKM